MGKIIPLQDYLDVTGKVTFDFTPANTTAEADRHLKTAETLREEAASQKAAAEKNWEKAKESSRKANRLSLFTPRIVAGIGLAVAAGLVIIFKRDVTDTVAALGLTKDTEIKMKVLYWAIAALTGFLCAYIAHTILSGKKDHAEKEANENLFLAEVHREHAAANEMLASEHIRRAFESTDD